MKYLCIIYGRGDEQPGVDWEQVKDRCIEEDHALFAAGKLIVASPLQGPETAVSIRYRREGRSRTDGPYMEAKEWIAGFMVIEAADMDEAVSIAADGALEGLADVEIRPLHDESHSVTGQDRSAFFRRG